MSDLPQGWVETTLGDLCQFNPKHDPEIDRSTDVNFIPMPAVDDETGRITDLKNVRPLSKVWKGYTHFADGDVIFAKITPCMENGKIAVARKLANSMACGSTEFHVLRSKGAVEPDFIWRFLRRKNYRQIAERSMTGAVGQRRVPKQFLESTELSLPPLAEQKRIVAKLDALSAKSTRARTELARIETLVARYKQAVLSKAFSGELTSAEVNRLDMSPEEAVGLPSHWSRVHVGAIADIKSGITLGKKRKPNESLLDRPYLRVANVQRGWLDLREVKTIEVTAREAEALYLREGDVLMNEGGDRDKLGRGWVWEGQIPNCIHQNHVFRLRLAPGTVPPRFLSYYANEFGQKHFFDEGKQTTNLASISKSKLSAMQIPVPPFEEAEEIVRRIETAFARIDRLAREAKRALDLLGKLDEAILAKAFRGELVPQGPNDEPAEQLLARIRAERAAAPKAKRGRRAQA